MRGVPLLGPNLGPNLGLNLRARSLTLGLILALAAGGASAAGHGDCPKPQELAGGVFVIYGSGGPPTRKNRGHVANTIILSGPTGFTVIDPGPNLRRGRSIACSIRRLGPNPVVAVINTHPHAENDLANSAFTGAPIYASSAAAEAMTTRCANCQQRLQRALGAAAMAGTRARIPDHPISGPTRISAGGRSLFLVPLGKAHSPGDLAILDETSGSLIGGDVTTISELPDLRDGTTQGFIAAVEQLQALPAQRVIPGRGPAYSPAGLALTLDYLKALNAAARHAADSGEWPPRIEREQEFEARFARFPELHPLNLQHALREAEDDWLSQSPPEAAVQTDQKR